MGILQTAERSSHLDPSENVIFQRHLIAYKEAAKLISGTVLEIGSGEGYGINELLNKSSSYIAIDKYKSHTYSKFKSNDSIEFHQIEVPPLTGIKDSSVDYVVSFQVIEHIKDDKFFLSEIKRVLKKGGKVIITTPNSKMSLTRNPWHYREYTPKQMSDLFKDSFDKFEIRGVFGNEKVMDYYKKNKDSVRKITRWDILNLQYLLPRWMLQIPYDILNRFNRQKLQDDNLEMVKNISHTDYSIKENSDISLDHFCVATKT